MTKGNGSEKAIEWFILNSMIINLEKFQLMSLQTQKTQKHAYFKLIEK